MNRLFLFLSLFCLGLLGCLSVLDPGSSVMWLASISIETNLLRVGLVFFLVVLLFTHPPRNKQLRALVGVLAIFVGLWATLQTYANNVSLLDGLAYQMTAVSMGIAILEYNLGLIKTAAKKAKGKTKKPRLQTA